MKPRTRDNLLYWPVGLSIAALLMADFFCADSRSREMWMPSRFTLRLVYTTALMVYFVARETRRMLHHLWVSGEVYEALHNSPRTTVVAAA